MWPSLTTEVLDRCSAVRSFFTAIAGPAGAAGAMPAPSHEIYARGIVFVQLYAVYEYTVNQTVRTAIQEINSHGSAISGIRLELLSLGLSPELQSITDCGFTKKWENRIFLLQRVDSADPLSIPDIFPKDGSHYRVRQLETIKSIFGFSASVVPSGPCLQLVEELVENRNAVSHGRKTAEDVGSGYSKNDVFRKIDLTEQLCAHLVTTLQEHCTTPSNFAR